MDGYVDVLALAELAPGSMRCVQVGARAILIANVAGTVYATDDACTHEDVSLSSGALVGARVKCALHGSRFCLRTGEPLEEPAEEPLRCYRTRIVDGRIQIGPQR